MPLTKLLPRFLNLRADARTLAIARIALGVCSLALAWENWRILQRLLNPMIVQLPYFEWLPRLTVSALPMFIGLWVIASAAFLVGWESRVAGAIITCFSAYLLLLDQQLYSNHFYLFFLIVLLLTVAESGAALSLDSFRRDARNTVAGWPVLLLMIQVSVVYGFSALAKLTPQYLSGEVLSQTLKRQGWFVFPEAWRTSACLSALAISAIVLELFIAFGLWNKRTRWFAVVGGLALHAFILATLDSSRLSLGVFALEMFALYPLFFQPRHSSAD
ncbi:MAG TPA: HTTM domain-containing protein [Pyrinomonadaceae bacterium]|nr:HTTM domain-containing protein [Pyrinomonadaceae bacterium]